MSFGPQYQIWHVVNIRARQQNLSSRSLALNEGPSTWAGRIWPIEDRSRVWTYPIRLVHLAQLEVVACACSVIV